MRLARGPDMPGLQTLFPQFRAVRRRLRLGASGAAARSRPQQSARVAVAAAVGGRPAVCRTLARSPCSISVNGTHADASRCQAKPRAFGLQQPVQDQQPAHEFVEGVAGDRQSGWLAALAGSAWTSVSSSSHAWLGLTSQDGCYCGGGKSVATLVADLHKREMASGSRVPTDQTTRISGRCNVLSRIGHSTYARQ
jgi:hypothetical protein